MEEKRETLHLRSPTNLVAISRFMKHFLHSETSANLPVCRKILFRSRRLSSYSCKAIICKKGLLRHNFYFPIPQLLVSLPINTSFKACLPLSATMTCFPGRMPVPNLHPTSRHSHCRSNHSRTSTKSSSTATLFSHISSVGGSRSGTIMGSIPAL